MASDHPSPAAVDERGPADELAHLSELIRESDDAIIGKTPEGVITSWNPGAERLYGYSASEVIGRQITLLALPGHEPQIAEILSRVAAGETVREQTVRRTKDGQTVPVALTVSPIHDARGQIIGAATIARDLSAQNRIESELRAGLHRWRSVFDRSRVGFGVLDRDARLVECNHRYAELFGATRKALLGASFAAVLDSQDAAALIARWPAIWEAQSSTQTEPTYRLADGREIRFRFNVASIDDDAGTPIHMVAMIDDVTEQARLDEEVARARRVDMIGRLAGGVAHELNNKLAVILGFNDLIAQRLDAEHPAHDALAEVRAAARHSISLTRELLAFGQRQALQPSPVIASEAAAVLSQILRSAFAGSDIEVVTSDDSAGAQVMADPTQLEHALISIALDAVEAMPGGGRLTLHTATSPATTSDSGSATVMISVSHTGTPQSGPASRDTAGELSRQPGVGLVGARDIIAQTGGTITTSARSDGGRAVIVALPALAPVTVAAPDAIGPPEVGLNILVVEDDAQLRLLLELTLQEAGHRVQSAATSADADAILNRSAEPIDLLLTDMLLPDGNGAQIGRTALRVRPDIPIIYTSGSWPAAVTAQSAPADGVLLTKPFTTADLNHAIHVASGSRP
ncbi:MAG: PAS domain S-box protein [Solirubrobacteraceae bacterium]